MPITTSSNGAPQRLKITALVMGMVCLVAATVGFSIATVQIQSAVAAYIGGQSVWSRAQLASIHYLHRYADKGQPEHLERAREWLEIPLADRRARQIMEAEVLDYSVARQALVLGDNHPDDVSRMIWLFRHFSTLDQLEAAVAIWQESDRYILALVDTAEHLEAEWQSGSPDPERLAALKTELEDLNAQLEPLTGEFRHTMTSAARWLTGLLSIASIGYLMIVALLAWLLGWRLVRVLRRSELKFRAIFEQAAVGMAQVHVSGRILEINSALCEVLEYPSEELLKLRYRDLVHPEDWHHGLQEVRALASGNLDSYILEQRMLTGAGETVWVRMSVSLVSDELVADPYYIVILEDVSESRRLSVELSHQATHDALTGLFNRRAFERRLADSLSRARTEQAQHALCFVDLDQFKLINDTCGHSAGDELLRKVAEIFRDILREGDMLARLGADEFGMILENCDLKTAVKVAEKLRRGVESSEFVWQERTYSVSCSVGLVPVLATTLDVESLMRAADIACYLAKERGRNRIYTSAEDDQQQLEHRGQMEWMNRIRDALQQDRLFLDAQMIDPTSSNSDGLRYEVLVRLRDEDGNVVPPGVFLPPAERFGAAHQIDRWVIEKVLSQLAAHPEHVAKLQSCHINLSGRSFDQPDFEHFVIEAFARHKVPEHKICFEITETAAVNNLVAALAFMETMKRRGCTFALDDFGTGLSSFSYLRRFPVDFLKIDGVFVRDMAEDNTDLAMVRAINDIGHTLGKRTIAEFVENDKIRALLSDIGVDSVQGFGVHRPSSFDDLLRG